MNVPKPPKYDWGQRVAAGVRLFNDGSYPECEEDSLLVEQGTLGEVVQVGKHVETDTTVYLVLFPGERVVGCLEEEIVPA